MDDIVLRGMARWPNVPSVYGWLSLDRRGQWLLKGDRVQNPGIIDFFGRNYSCDDSGRWFVQNGPQRVFVRLDYTPYVYRFSAGAGIQAHTGSPAGTVTRVCIDELGHVLLEAGPGIGLVHDADLDTVVAALRGADGKPPGDAALENALSRLQSGKPVAMTLDTGSGPAPVFPIASADVPARYGFNPCPLQPAGEEECY